MKLIQTIRRVIEIDPESPDVDFLADDVLDQLHDSFVDDLNDAQDTTHETSDNKVLYVPGETLEFKLEEYKG